MNGLAEVADILITGRNEIHIDEAVRVKALRSVQRMLDFAAQNRAKVLGEGNA